MSQNFKNHLRFYPPHHFVFYPLLLFALCFALKMATTAPQNRVEWWAVSVLFFMLGWLSFMMRQHYALINQDRIIRLEMRLRYYQLTQQRFEPMEQKLSFGQIAALRFAGDQELVDLCNRAAKENLAPNAIKQAITDWQADLMRV